MVIHIIYMPKCKSCEYLTSKFAYHGGMMIKDDDSWGKLTNKQERNLWASFGTRPLICSIIWRRISPTKHGVLPVHILWSLLFLKTGDTNNVLS